MKKMSRKFVSVILAFVLLVLQDVRSTDPRCRSAFGLFADPSSCERYVSCWGGRGFSLSCGRRMVFNPDTLTCELGNKCPTRRFGTPVSGEAVRLRRNFIIQQATGFLELRMPTQWALVVANGFSDHEATLVCRRMGYKSFSSWTPSVWLKRGRQSTTFTNLRCASDAQTLSQCDALQCSQCTSSGTQVVSIKCSVESASRCPLSSRSWQRWGENCYLAKPELRMNRLEATDLCAAAHGTLVSIDEQMEHEFVSSLLKSGDNSQSDFYTDGAGVILAGGGIMWAWQTSRFPLKYSRWWPGWAQSSVSLRASSPSPSFSPSCLILRRAFPPPPMSPLRRLRRKTSSFLTSSRLSTAFYDADFFFFDAADCGTRRPFVCEAPLRDFGCRERIGTTYSGIANVSISGHSCLPWSDPRLNTPLGRALGHFDTQLLGEHNFCRNPNGASSPWCFIAPGKTEECDIPACERSAFQTFLERAARIPHNSPRRPVLVNELSPPPKNDFTRKPTLTDAPLIISTPQVVRPNKKVRCSIGEHECELSGTCVRRLRVCDGTRHCARGDDENDCDRFLSSFELSAAKTPVIRHLLRTLYRQEIGVCAKKCLGDNRCKGFIYEQRNRECGLSRLDVGSSGLVYSSHEDFYELRSRQSSCGLRSNIRCANGRCVKKSLKCDGKDDCADGTDESHCAVGRQTVEDIRLIGGLNDREGSVQLRLPGGQWGFVCDDDFGWSEADVICKQLDFTSAYKFTRNNHFGNKSRDWLKSTPSFSLSDLKCKGDETKLTKCAAKKVGHDCGPTEIAGVICRSSSESCSAGQFECGDVRRTCVQRSRVCDQVANCPDQSDESVSLCEDVDVVRLQSSQRAPLATAGTVLLKREGKWGTVCDDAFDDQHAKVVCRSLGFSDLSWSTSYSKAFFGRGPGNVLLDEAGCIGSETSLQKCPGHAWGPGNCDHSEDAGVFCSEQEKIRLTNGTSSSQGRVEVLLGGVWGDVCADDFDDYDAKVICRMAGYAGGGIAHRDNRFGRGISSRVWLSGVDCKGDENALRNCARTRPATQDCARKPHAAVTCYHNDPSHNFDRSLKRKLPLSCGRKSSSSFGSFLLDNLAKIVGGRSVKRHDTPWLVSLQLKEKGSKQKHNCGGVVLSEDLVLTAAHCFRTHNKNAYVVRVGDFDLHSHEQSQKDFNIDKLYVHDDFDTKIEFNNDIALLKISRRNGRGIRLNGHIDPICLPRANADYSKLRNCKITGWGTTNEQAEPVPQRKPRSGRVRIFPMSACIKSSSKTKTVGYGRHEVTSGMFCAGQMDGSVDTCTGDSGGPLTCKVDGQEVLFGITSWGKGCGRAGQPGMYTKVTKYVRWLSKIVN